MINFRKNTPFDFGIVDLRKGKLQKLQNVEAKADQSMLL